MRVSIIVDSKIEVEIAKLTISVNIEELIGFSESIS